MKPRLQSKCATIEDKKKGQEETSQRKYPVLGKDIALSRESNGHDVVNLHHRSLLL